jgi:hypothetical protein
MQRVETVIHMPRLLFSLPGLLAQVTVVELALPVDLA